ncbi:PAS domain-containing sensor histidine kinase [Halodesulfurarchaeum sp. HSR-GB]|uniref:PAS domain-containing sensor histidine kinase n=1 Tax=Halodesulfurarchaeum sp. HSR-GB TaxID=3074077 RepID=UPI00285AA872|nr:PAS domain-containing sensor histidine kinase [Halodesulfurarchaeum sp. HSR-GB]MDR5656954.1 PAS domain-containing sensor histidine kinase [Halodesulfurarchaeum sp. HSR-GB]
MKEGSELGKNSRIQRLRTAMRAANIAWWEMEMPEGTTNFHDRKAEVLGYDPSNFNNYEDFTSLLHPDDYDRAMTAMKRHLNGEAERYEVEYRIEANDGSYHWFHDIGSITDRYDDGAPKLVSGLVIDISARKEYKEQIAEQRDNLEVLNQVLRHDIRNDLQLISAYTDLLAENPEESQEYIDKIQKNARHAIDLTTTARDMAEVWVSETENLVEVPIKPVLESGIQNVQSTARDPGVSTNGSIPDRSVRADNMLNSVFNNILMNAVQHNDKSRPKIEVEVEESNEFLQVRIADNGPGISDDQKEAIFGKGEKGLDSTGSGLGLHLVKSLVERYHGDIYVEDNNPEGAVFVVELPKYTPSSS